MARAMGFGAGQTYVATALPRHTPLPDWAGLALDGLGEVLLHHLALAAPRRLIVLGRDVLPLLGHDPAQSAPFVSEVSIQSGQVPLLASYAPGRLLEHSRFRADLWRRWLEWTGPTGE
jgi:DNA polymerase